MSEPNDQPGQGVHNEGPKLFGASILSKVDLSTLGVRPSSSSSERSAIPKDKQSPYGSIKTKSDTKASQDSKPIKSTSDKFQATSQVEKLNQTLINSPQTLPPVPESGIGEDGEGPSSQAPQNNIVPTSPIQNSMPPFKNDEKRNVPKAVISKATPNLNNIVLSPNASVPNAEGPKLFATSVLSKTGIVPSKISNQRRKPEQQQVLVANDEPLNRAVETPKQEPLSHKNQTHASLERSETGVTQPSSKNAMQLSSQSLIQKPSLDKDQHKLTDTPLPTKDVPVSNTSLASPSSTSTSRKEPPTLFATKVLSETRLSSIPSKILKVESQPIKKDHTPEVENPAPEKSPITENQIPAKPQIIQNPNPVKLPVPEIQAPQQTKETPIPNSTVIQNYGGDQKVPNTSVSNASPATLKPSNEARKLFATSVLSTTGIKPTNSNRPSQKCNPVPEPQPVQNLHKPVIKNSVPSETQLPNPTEKVEIPKIPKTEVPIRLAPSILSSTADKQTTENQTPIEIEVPKSGKANVTVPPNPETRMNEKVPASNTPVPRSNDTIAKPKPNESEESPASVAFKPDIEPRNRGSPNVDSQPKLDKIEAQPSTKLQATEKPFAQPMEADADNILKSPIKIPAPSDDHDQKLLDKPELTKEFQASNITLGSPNISIPPKNDVPNLASPSPSYHSETNVRPTSQVPTKPLINEKQIPDQTENVQKSFSSTPNGSDPKKSDKPLHKGHSSEPNEKPPSKSTNSVVDDQTKIPPTSEPPTNVRSSKDLSAAPDSKPSNKSEVNPSADQPLEGNPKEPNKTPSKVTNPPAPAAPPPANPAKPKRKCCPCFKKKDPKSTPNAKSGNKPKKRCCKCCSKCCNCAKNTCLNPLCFVIWIIMVIGTAFILHLMLKACNGLEWIWSGDELLTTFAYLLSLIFIGFVLFFCVIFLILVKIGARHHCCGVTKEIILALHLIFGAAVAVYVYTTIRGLTGGVPGAGGSEVACLKRCLAYVLVMLILGVIPYVIFSLAYRNARHKVAPELTKKIQRISTDRVKFQRKPGLSKSSLQSPCDCDCKTFLRDRLPLLKANLYNTSVRSEAILTTKSTRLINSKYASHRNVDFTNRNFSSRSTSRNIVNMPRARSPSQNKNHVFVNIH